MEYKWILIKKEDNKYITWHNSESMPKYGNNGNEKDTDSDVKWIEWNKPLPDDIEEKEYFYIDGALILK